jgi:hypothetical protein
MPGPGARNRLRASSSWPCGEPREVAVHPANELDLVNGAFGRVLVVPVLQDGRGDRLSGAEVQHGEGHESVRVPTLGRPAPLQAAG